MFSKNCVTKMHCNLFNQSAVAGHGPGFFWFLQICSAFCVLSSTIHPSSKPEHQESTLNSSYLQPILAYLVICFFQFYLLRIPQTQGQGRQYPVGKGSVDMGQILRRPGEETLLGGPGVDGKEWQVPACARPLPLCGAWQAPRVLPPGFLPVPVPHA